MHSIAKCSFKAKDIDEQLNIDAEKLGGHLTEVDMHGCLSADTSLKLQLEPLSRVSVLQINPG